MRGPLSLEAWSLSPWQTRCTDCACLRSFWHWLWLPSPKLPGSPTTSGRKPPYQLKGSRGTWSHSGRTVWVRPLTSGGRWGRRVPHTWWQVGAADKLSLLASPSQCGRWPQSPRLGVLPPSSPSLPSLTLRPVQEGAMAGRRRRSLRMDGLRPPQC